MTLCDKTELLVTANFTSTTNNAQHLSNRNLGTKAASTETLS